MAGYGSDQGFADYTAAAGYTVPSGTVAAARQRGSAYLDGTYEMAWPGTPTGGAAQERSWPRTGAEDRYGNAIDPSTIPQRVINASYEAALLELQSPGSLAALATAAGRVVMERVEGAVTVQYSDPGTSGDVLRDNTPVSTLIAGILAPLLMPVLPAALVV